MDRASQRVTLRETCAVSDTGCHTAQAGFHLTMEQGWPLTPDLLPLPPECTRFTGVCHHTQFMLRWG